MSRRRSTKRFRYYGSEELRVLFECADNTQVREKLRSLGTHYYLRESDGYISVEHKRAAGGTAFNGDQVVPERCRAANSSREGASAADAQTSQTRATATV